MKDLRDLKDCKHHQILNGSLRGDIEVDLGERSGDTW